MGFCFEERNNRSDTSYRKNIQNTYISNNINNMNVNVNNYNNNTNNNVCVNNFSSNNCCCPSCGEPAGNNFKGSGTDYESFTSLKCGESQSEANYYKCKKCNGIFCSQCPKRNDGILAFCPSCGERAGNEFKGSFKDYESFNCLKCGMSQSVANYYKCKKCQGIFCYNCPFVHN